MNTAILWTRIELRTAQVDSDILAAMEVFASLGVCVFARASSASIITSAPIPMQIGG